LDSIIHFVNFIVSQGDPEKFGSVLELISDTLCSLIYSKNTTLSGLVSSLMESFVTKLSRNSSEDSSVFAEAFSKFIFSCDVCKCSPIVGKHWRCCECKDFDLCDKCHSKCTSFEGDHLPSHKMVVHDDGRVITCDSCKKSMLATRWFACSSCNATVCCICAKDSSKQQHCPGSTLNEVTSEQQPPASFLLSLFQTCQIREVEPELSGESVIEDILSESKKPFDFVSGCACSRESADEDDSKPVSMDVDKDPSTVLSMTKIFCSKLLQLVQKFDVSSATINDIKALVPVLCTLHTVCYQLFVSTHDLSLLNPVFEIFTRANASIPSVLVPDINGKFTILLVLFEKALLESILGHLQSTKSSTDLLNALVQQIVTPELLEAVRKILGEECFKTDKCAAAEPMAVDGAEKPDSFTPQSLLELLNPALRAVSKPQSMVCEPLVSSEYSSMHVDIFENYNEIVTLALLEFSFATLKIIKPDGMYKTWEPTIQVALGVRTSKYIRRIIKSFARFVCADDVVYLMIRDGNMLGMEIKWLSDEATRSDNFTVPLSSSEASRAIDHVSALTKLTKKRRAVWKTYCFGHPDVYRLLYSILSSISVASIDSVPSELLSALMYLLCMSLSEVPKSTNPKNSTVVSDEDDEGGKAYSDPSPNEKEFIQFIVRDNKVLTRFANSYALHCSDLKVRTDASDFLKRAWYHTSDPECKRVLKELFTQMIQSAPVFGAQAMQFMTALGCMFQPHKASKEEGESKSEAEMLVIDPKVIVSMLRSQNRVLLQHPNASLYRRIGSVIGDSSKCLFEGRPCLRCNSASTAFQETDLGSISNQMRATSTARFYRLKNTYMINSVHLTIQKRRSSSRTVKVLNIYVNTRHVSDVIDLRDKWDLWKRVQSIRLPAGVTESTVSFPHPLSAANICLEVAELHEESRKEALKCPRCSSSVPDRHGVCSHCGENAYQCRNCRYIPYENYDAFFCPQCGQSKDCQFEVTMSVCQSFVPEPVETDDDLKKATETIESQATEASNSLLRLSTFRTEASLLLYP